MSALVISGERCVSVGAACRDAKWREQLVKNVTSLIFNAAQYCGQVMTMEDAAVHAGYYCKDLQQHFPGIDTVEVKTIFENGVRDEYGEYYGLNARTFYRWTQAYVNSEDAKRRQIQKERLAAQIEERPPLTEEEVKAVMTDSINRAYKRYCSVEVNNSEEPKPGSIGAAFRKMGYNPQDPLCDLGRARERFLNDNGIAGTLKEIFDNARKAGKDRIL